VKQPAPKRRVTYRQEDGDDGYCYCVRVDGKAVTHASLTRTEAMHYRDRVEGDLVKKGEKLRGRY
jgi:hypothetical protein